MSIVHTWVVARSETIAAALCGISSATLGVLALMVACCDLFETGDREEDRVVSNLRAVGVKVWEKDPETGKQIRFTECGGHFALSLDGVGEGFKESDTPHTLEFKTMNEKNFKAMKNLGLQEVKAYLLGAMSNWDALV